MGSGFKFKRNHDSNGKITLTDIKVTEGVRYYKCTCNKVLIVDDNECNLFVITNYLKSENIESDFAFNGKEAITKVQKKSVDPICKSYKLIIMDINMPIMDGITATKKLKFMMNKNEIQVTPILALSAQSIKEDEYEIYCNDVGFSDYLIKPITRIKFISAIKKYGF